MNNKSGIEGKKTGTSYVKRKKAIWIGHIWCRNCLLKHVIGGKIEGRLGVT
jgi:hypothetical protein